jgi:hypothetical protein
MSSEWRADTVKFFLDEIEIWKQKEIDDKATLDLMTARHASDPSSVTLHALEQMKQNVEYDMDQRREKESEVERLLVDV